MPETSFPVEDELRPEVEVGPASDVEVPPDIEVIFEEDPARRRRRALAARVVVAAIILAGLIATALMIFDGSSDSGSGGTSPGATSGVEEREAGHDEPSPVPYGSLRGARGEGGATT